MKIRSATLEYQGQVFTFASKPVFGATGAWVLEDVTGWFGGVGVRAETTDRLGHGMFQQRAWRSNRALTLAATYIANEPDERLALQRALSGMMWAGDYGTLTVDADQVLSCPVRLDGEVGMVELGTHGVQLQVPLVSADPWLYAPERVVYANPVGIGVAMAYPLFGVGGALTYGAARNDSQPVTNYGTATAYPSMWVYGDFPGGFKITAAGKTVQWPWPTSPAQPVRIEHSGSVWSESSNVTHLATLKQWMPLEAGATYKPQLYALQGGTGYLETHIRDTYI